MLTQFICHALSHPEAGNFLNSKEAVFADSLFTFYFLTEKRQFFRGLFHNDHPE
jgi:hypothetical protein